MACGKSGVLLFASMLAFSVGAQEFVTSALGKRTTLSMYSTSDGSGERQQIELKDIAFPLKIFETSDAGYLRVKLAGKDVWLDRKQVKVPPEKLESSCLTVNRANASLVSGGIRGANEGCK